MFQIQLNNLCGNVLHLVLSSRACIPLTMHILFCVRCTIPSDVMDIYGVTQKLKASLKEKRITNKN